MDTKCFGHLVARWPSVWKTSNIDFFCKKGVAAEKSPLTSADQRIDKIFTKYDES